MKVGMICFTTRGTGTCHLLYDRFRDAGTEYRGYVSRRFQKPEWEAEGILPQDRSLSEWTGPMFGQKRALVFIGAVGIAVRAIAPYVRDKMTNPPVVAADEARHSCIPLLSDHVGGANELAKKMAGWLSDIPVITTATDINGVFAVDIFAARNDLCITDRKEAKETSARLLDGGEVGSFCSPEYHGAGSAKGIYRHSIRMNRVCGHNIWITFRSNKRPSLLRLVPRMVTMGMDCRKGTPPDVLERRVLEALEGSGIDSAAVKALPTIDIKTGKAVVSQLAGRYGWELRTFTAGEPLAVKGKFGKSEFVKTAVGVGSVCERSCTAKRGILLTHKRAGEGVTVAVAIEPAAGAGHNQQQPVIGKLDIGKCSRI